MAHATERVDLMTYVTCPTVRYHPAVVAQKAATVQLLADGRFTLGLGSGENLNEHVVGEGWDAVATRQDLLEEAIEVIRALHTGELVDHHGEYFRVESARIWDLPEGGVPIGVAVSGEKSITRFGPLADHMVAVEPKPTLVDAWNATQGAPTIGWPAAPRHRADPDLLGPGREGRCRAGPRPVPVVRRRVVGQRRPADDGGLRRRDPVRPPRGRRGLDPVRPGPRRHRRGRGGVQGGRVHRPGAGADRRRSPGAVPRRGRRATAGAPALLRHEVPSECVPRLAWRRRERSAPGVARGGRHTRCARESRHNRCEGGH